MNADTQKLIDDSLANAVLIKHPSAECPASIHTNDPTQFKVLGAILEWAGIQGKNMVAPSTPDSVTRRVSIPQYGWEITDTGKFEPYAAKVGKTIEIEPHGTQGLAEVVRVAMEIPSILKREFEARQAAQR